jgi:hypothetical protein
MGFMFCRYQCGYGPKDHHEHPNDMRSIKHGCLAHFSMRKFDTWSNVVEITFYHWVWTQPNQDAHGACESGSITQMFLYVSHVS